MKASYLEGLKTLPVAFVDSKRFCIKMYGYYTIVESLAEAKRFVGMHAQGPNTEVTFHTIEQVIKERYAKPKDIC